MLRKVAVRVAGANGRVSASSLRSAIARCDVTASVGKVVEVIATGSILTTFSALLRCRYGPALAWHIKWQVPCSVSSANLGPACLVAGANGWVSASGLRPFIARCDVAASVGKVVEVIAAEGILTTLFALFGCSYGPALAWHIKWQ